MRRAVTALALAGLTVTTALFARDGGPAAPRPKLLVLVVFDQLRGDYLERWKPLFGPGGFARLQSEGAWFTNCHYPYAATMTGPGHASVLTGTSPHRHGIVTNDWYDRAAGEKVYCASHPRYEPVPPAPPVKKVESPKLTDKPAEKPKEKTVDEKVWQGRAKKSGGSPERMTAESLADVLKAATGGKARVFGVSLKDRAAILPAGQRPDGAYWFDSGNGRYVTSTYYRDRAHPWVESLNSSKPFDRWFGQKWERLRPDLNYDALAGRDDGPGEGPGPLGKLLGGRTFPHDLVGKDEAPGKDYYEAVTFSPFGNDIVLDIAKAAVVEEKLGRGEATDLLAVSFSSNDLIGHAWGPDSHEVLDVTLRSDRLMADFLSFLDERVGKGNYLLALTADHGICPLPEHERAAGRDAVRVDPYELTRRARRHLSETFLRGEPGDHLWFDDVSFPWFYLNARLLSAHRLDRPAVEAELAAWLARQAGVQSAWTRAQLTGRLPVPYGVGRSMRAAFHPDRCGDVGVVLDPYNLLDAQSTSTGTTHGSPHDYDTHVPLLFFGTGVRAAVTAERVTPQATAAVFARAAGVKPPAACEYGVPAALAGGR